MNGMQQDQASVKIVHLNVQFWLDGYFFITNSQSALCAFTYW